MGKCLAGAALYRSQVVYQHGHFWRNKQQVVISKFQAMTPQCLGREKELVPQNAKYALLQLTQKMELKHRRSRLRSFVKIMYLRFAYRVCIFILCVILVGPRFATSHFLIMINLFCFISVLAHSKFLQISSHCETMTQANDMQQCYNNSNNNDDNDDDDDDDWFSDRK